MKLLEKTIKQNQPDIYKEVEKKYYIFKNNLLAQMN